MNNFVTDALPEIESLAMYSLIYFNFLKIKISIKW